LIAAGNSGDRNLIDAVTSHLAAGSPLVRAMAAWALRRLLDEPEVAPHRQAALATETDADVIAEWTGATGPAAREAPRS
jgi:epoxyqueuosine reductase